MGHSPGETDMEQKASETDVRTTPWVATGLSVVQINLSLSCSPLGVVWVLESAERRGGAVHCTHGTHLLLPAVVVLSDSSQHRTSCLDL